MLINITVHVQSSFNFNKTPMSTYVRYLLQIVVQLIFRDPDVNVIVRHNQVLHHLGQQNQLLLQGIERGLHQELYVLLAAAFLGFFGKF